MGHGQGRCVYQAAAYIECESHGIEYAPDKYHLSNKVKSMYLDRFGKDPLFNLTKMMQGDVTKRNNLNGYTHIYTYNKTWENDLMDKFVAILNETEFHVLVWSKNPHNSERYGLTRVKFVERIACSNAGGEQTSFYVYLKTPKEASTGTDTHTNTHTDIYMH